MPDDFGVGMSKLEKKLLSVANTDLTPALNRACIIVENAAKKNCSGGLFKEPTGQLKNSITHEVRGTEGRVGTNTEYAPFVEFGTGAFSTKGTHAKKIPWAYKDDDGNWHQTRGQKPKPFLHKALSENRSAVIKEIQKSVLQGMKTPTQTEE